MPACPRCHQLTEDKDCYCRYCGKALRPYMGFWFDHGGILLMTLLVGPFSLLCVWLSRRISLQAKWIWSGAIILTSVYIIYAMCRALSLFKEAFAVMFPL